MAYVREGGIESAWSWINYPYVGMISCLIAAYAMTNWYQVADKIQKQDVTNPSPSLDSGSLDNMESASLVRSTNSKKSQQYGSDFQVQVVVRGEGIDGHDVISLAHL